MELHLIINGEVEKNWQMQFLKKFQMDNVNGYPLVVIQLMLNGVAFANGAEIPWS
jgi:hypothetical protein